MGTKTRQAKIPNRYSDTFNTNISFLTAGQMILNPNESRFLIFYNYELVVTD